MATSENGRLSCMVGYKNEVWWNKAPVLMNFELLFNLNFYKGCSFTFFLPNSDNCVNVFGKTAKSIMPPCPP